MSIDNSAPIDLQTGRGRDYPALLQFTVFLENRLGQLHEVIRRFEGSQVKIVAFSVVESGECAFGRFLLSHAEQGREILERAGLAIVESDLLAVELPDEKHSLFDVATALLQGEVNIIQAYPLIARPRDKAALAIMVDDIEMGLEILQRKGMRLLTEDDFLEA